MIPRNISKTFAAKAEATEVPGEFVAIVSAFGNEDSQGDIVERGAFTKTLAEWTIKGRPIPVVWSHQFTDPYSILGKYVEAEETDAGLKMRGQLNLDFEKSRHVYELMKEELIYEFSISGRVRDYELIEDDDADSWWPAMRIKDIDLWEAGPCFKGANPETELLSVKADGSLSGSLRVLKEGRVLAQKHVDALKEAHGQIGQIIEAVDKKPDEPEPEPETEETEGTPAKAASLSHNVRALLELVEID